MFNRSSYSRLDGREVAAAAAHALRDIHNRVEDVQSHKRAHSRSSSTGSSNKRSRVGGATSLDKERAPFLIRKPTNGTRALASSSDSKQPTVRQDAAHKPFANREFPAIPAPIPANPPLIPLGEGVTPPAEKHRTLPSPSVQPAATFSESSVSSVSHTCHRVAPATTYNSIPPLIRARARAAQRARLSDATSLPKEKDERGRLTSSTSAIPDDVTRFPDAQPVPSRSRDLTARPVNPIQGQMNEMAKTNVHVYAKRLPTIERIQGGPTGKLTTSHTWPCPYSIVLKT